MKFSEKAFILIWKPYGIWLQKKQVKRLRTNSQAGNNDEYQIEKKKKKKSIGRVQKITLRRLDSHGQERDTGWYLKSKDSSMIEGPEQRWENSKMKSS
jgi:hypothetical protein